MPCHGIIRKLQKLPKVEYVIHPCQLAVYRRICSYIWNMFIFFYYDQNNSFQFFRSSPTALARQQTWKNYCLHLSRRLKRTQWIVSWLSFPGRSRSWSLTLETSQETFSVNICSTFLLTSFVILGSVLI